MTVVRSERADDVVLIHVDNPPVNALSHAVREQLLLELDRADSDVTCAAIVIICDGRTFFAGADIKEFGQPPKSPWLPDVVARIEASKTPVIAAIHGSALGGGLEVALACHYRIAVESATLGLPEVNLGLLPGAAGTQRLPRLIGAPDAMDIMLSGKPLPAAKMRLLGAVDRIVPDENLEADAVTFARECTSRGPRRISDIPAPSVHPHIFETARERIAKKARGQFAPERIIRCVEAATTLPYAKGVELERKLFQECMASPQSSAMRYAFFAERTAGSIAGIDKKTTVRSIDTIAVIGAGTMGAGIAYSALLAGLTVFLVDNNDDALQRGAETIRSYLDDGVRRERVTDDFRDDCLARLTATQVLNDVADADLVVEAVVEDMQVKKRVFAELDDVMRAGAILATNTSTLDVADIASATQRPADVIGLHFFSPAHIMRLLEIVRAAETSEDVVATALRLAKRLGKIGVVVGNCFGFIGNRMLYNYGRENQFLLLEGASPQQIDQALVRWGMAMGPNAVGDLAGLDIGYQTRRAQKKLSDDPRFYRIADKLVEQGRFGQKTGMGMYRYDERSRTPLPDPEVDALILREAEALGIRRRDIEDEEIVSRCITALINEGAHILQEGIAERASDIDVIWLNGYGFPRFRGGPMFHAETLGIDSVYQTVCDFRDKFGSEFWTPSALLEKLATEKGSFT